MDVLQHLPGPSVLSAGGKGRQKKFAGRQVGTAQLSKRQAALPCLLMGFFQTLSLSILSPPEAFKIQLQLVLDTGEKRGRGLQGKT